VGPYRRRLIALAIVAALVCAYAIAGFFAVPHFARQSASDFVRTHYARILTIGDLRFNPFTLNLEVSGVALPDADGQTMLSFDRLRVGLQLASLWRLGPSFGEIVLERPYVRAVIRANGELNLADLGKGFAAPPPHPGKKPGPMRLYIGRLAVIDGGTTFEDRTRPTPFRADFKPIAFELRDFSTTAATDDAYTLAAASPQGERLDWSGTVRLTPLASHGRFSITDLKARTLWSYVSASVPFEIDSGVIALSGDYDVSAAGAGPIGVRVDVHNTTVTSLGVKPRGAADDYISLGRIQVDDTRLDLGRRAVEVAKVQLAGGEIRSWLGEEGRLNLLDLTAPAPGAAAAAAADTRAAGGGAPAAPPSPAAAAPASAWSVSVPDISVTGLKVSAEDRQVKPAAVVVLDPLNVHVAGFNLRPDDTLDIQLDTAVNTSGKVTAQAKVAPGSGAVTAHIEAGHLGLAALQPLLGKYTSMTLLKGELGTRGDFERRADGALSVKGEARISDLSTVDNALRNDFIRWKDVRVAQLSYRSRPASLRIGSVTALEPYVRMIIAPDRSVNIRQVLTPPGTNPPQVAPGASAAPAAEPAAAVASAAGESSVPDAAAAAPQAAPAPRARARKGTAAAAKAAAPVAPLTPFPVSIGAVRMVNGSADYTDLWIKPSFALGMQALNGAVTGLSSDPNSRARVQLDGKLASYSPLRIAGEVNLLSAALYTDVTLSFKDLDLTIVNPYSGYFVGYKIDKGKLSVDVSYKVDHRQLNAAQHFVVDQLELGDRVESPEAMHLPLKIAVALLKDRNGVIDLPLPMSGSLDDPSFRIGPIIWKMFVNLIAKVATAPFALLGHLFGGGEHMNIVEFAAGSAELAPPAKDQLAALTKAMKERPQLKLDVPIVSSVGLDRPQLARARLVAELTARAASSRQGRKHPQEAAELALADPARHLQLLIEQFQADLGKDAPLPASAEAVQAGKKKEPADSEAAIADLETALIKHLQIPDTDLEALGRGRAEAIRNALLADGQIDPARVFVVNAAPKPDSGDTVKVELAVQGAQ
jgi:uncharacterized protein involved in outer membrane biogenesis